MIRLSRRAKEEGLARLIARRVAINFALDQGWKSWGNKDALYRCFRHKNEYLWIGPQFMERSTKAIAVDFVHNPDAAKQAIKRK